MNFNTDTEKYIYHLGKLNRAFHKGFVVRVSPIVKENESNYSIRQFDGKPMQLPQSEKWFPSIEALKWHNGKLFVL